jgi:hypothetical protein
LDLATAWQLGGGRTYSISKLQARGKEREKWEKKGEKGEVLQKPEIVPPYM